jgi:diguanylate cyclase (GGDEF)-like protein/PAS domain S-box-containing protein
MNLPGRSIKSKIMLITTLTSTVGLVLASLGFLAYDLLAFRRLLSRDLLTHAEIIGANCTAAVSFEDQKAATDALAALGAKKEIMAAGIYLPDGRLFAQYTRADASLGPLAAHDPGDASVFIGGRLRVLHEIHFQGENLGTLVIESDMSQWNSRLKSYATILGILLLLSAIVTLAVSAELQGLISKPILELQQTMQTVTTEKNYTLRVERRTEDEVGRLIDGFNAMLAEIQERDDALRTLNETLEARVAERSAAAEARAQELARIGEALRTQTRILHSILDSMGDGVVVVSEEGFFVLFNPAAEQILRISLVDASLADLTDRMDLRRADMVTRYGTQDLPFARAIRGEAVDSEEIYVRGVEGGVWLSVNARPLKSEEGRQSGVAVFRDVTGQRKAQEALRESEERYALAVRGANDGLWDWNLKTNEIYLSPRWKAMLGYDENEIGNSLAEWFGRIHPEDLPRVQAGIAAHLEGKTLYYESEHQMLHKNGGTIWMLTRGLAYRDTNGVPLRMAGSQTDIAAGKVADVLTGLPNRILFMDRIRRAMDRAKRHPGNLVGILFVDLDRFKLVNDSLGHVVGDELLVAIARRLEACVRTGSLGRMGTGHTVARLGGDEFTILLDDIKDVNDATRVAERVTATLSEPFHLSGQEVFATASIGIAVTTAPDDLPEDLLRNADTAMYRAKTAGKARYEIFDAAMRERAVARMQLETDLRRAMDHREFRVHYQPITSLVTGRTIGFEGLVRWQHPVRGLIAPVEFIPMAEETGLIVPLGQWVLHEACRQMQEWMLRYRTIEPLTISVNLSSKQFAQRDLIDQIRNVLRETSLDPRSLKLEITESLIMEDPIAAIAMIQQLRDLEIRASIDDFGTGYSSLSYLHRFPVDTLKVDRSFVSGMHENEEDREIVRTIVTLAHNLGLNVIAEGVETVDQMAHLKALNCEYAQGYLFSVPVPSEGAEQIVIAETVRS